GVVTGRLAKRLAVWMSYEDAIRVADLKTRARRFERIRREHGAADDQVLRVTDYLKPDLDELYGILPLALGAPIARWCEARWPEGRPTIGQHVRTTSVLGYARVWALGRLRFLRPTSLRAQREFALIDRWQAAVLDTLALDAALAAEVADMATVVRGYGEVRRRLSAAFVRGLDDILAPAGARDPEQAAGYPRPRNGVRRGRETLLADENGLHQGQHPRQAGRPRGHPYPQSARSAQRAQRSHAHRSGIRAHRAARRRLVARGDPHRRPARVLGGRRCAACASQDRRGAPPAL